MTPIDPAELSALLDGELSSQRARQVQAAIEQDETIRAEFERLRQLDAACRLAAADAVFQPRPIIAPTPQPWPLVPVMMAAVVILVVRFLPKVLDLATAGVLLNAVAFAAVTMWVIKLIRQEDATPEQCSLVRA